MTTNVAIRNNATQALAAAAQPTAARPAAESPAETELAALRAQLAALQSENASLKNRKAPSTGKVSFSVSTKPYTDPATGLVTQPKGTVSIYGINTRFPVSMYPEALVRFAEALMDGSGIRVLEENAAVLSVRINDEPQRGTAASTAKVRELANTLRKILGK